ncbi:MAG TPA: bifunctional demethylmenaquinone methyltransferase/2-methoxy-6-polyprenyl-1,4-benzoquinol methylase UbiE [Candidatus Nitrosopolaris sp.]|nr:bifunctional demethylmenaquinone methyltransferase/2-methoxy-6-polyprenyl-1,4-benzoquinol methylase UbiE [Candidatus Nitrosopolaris sp.]
MSNVFYAPGGQRAAKVNDLFAAIARRYDLLNDLQSFGLHRRWKRRVIELAALKSDNRALDLCCGTGDIALALAQCGAEVVGLDFSEAMLAIAEKRRQKAPPGHNANLRFIRGDAQQIPFPDNSFDAVTVGYGLRNLASWETGLAEMARVARPGGRLVVLDFGKPANPLWRAVYFAHLKIFVPLLGWIFSGHAQAYAYILESLTHYPAQSGVAARMRDLNFANVRVINLLGGAMAINYGEKALPLH